jgi:DNA invertase Pin-like site-specific DNA recombinase
MRRDIVGNPVLIGYGRASTDKQAMTPETQQAMTFADFGHRKLTARIPENTEWGGFFCDADVSSSLRFLQRPMGQHVASIVKPGDFICVAAFDRFIGSAADCEETIEWARTRKVQLVIMDMPFDSSTAVGETLLGVFAVFKKYNRFEISRRTREDKAHRRAMGYPHGPCPIGYQIKTIVTLDGKKRKWFFPWQKERDYCRMIAFLNQDLGMSVRAIAEKFQRENYCKPRSGKPTKQYSDIAKFLRAYKQGYPLHGGVQWKAPDFRYKFDGGYEEIDLIADCA